MLYWDTKNGGGNNTIPTGTWDASTTANWNTDSAGSANPGQVVWTNGRTAVFSAGTTATGAFTVTISGTVSAAGVTSEEGTPTITGGTLSLTGATINTPSALTINSIIAGSVGLTKTGTNTLTLGGANTYTGVTTVSGGTLQAGANLNFSDGLNLGVGTTLALNDKSVSVGTLNITGNSIIDFGSGSSSLSVTTLNISAGATLTINNWVDAVDSFLASTFTGATSGVRGSGTSSQVIFNGFAGSSTLWAAGGQITPVPEPSAYGALLLGLVTGGYVWRRRKAA